MDKIIVKTESSDDIIENIHNIIFNSKKRLTWDELFMINALVFSGRSSCERLKVGCVLVKNNRVISSGYNGFLPGAPHTSRVRDGHEQGTVHAEQNTIANAARNNCCVDNSIAYITHFPCINCAKILVASGIKIIKYKYDYKNDNMVKTILEEANIDITKI